MAVHAFNRLRLPLVIAGDGPDMRRLRRLAGPTDHVRGPRVSDEHVARLLEGCRALIVTAVEEFGIAAVEAQAAGRPVISVAARRRARDRRRGRDRHVLERRRRTQLADAVAASTPTPSTRRSASESARRFDVAGLQAHAAARGRARRRPRARGRARRPARRPGDRPVAVPGQLARGGLARIS